MTDLALQLALAAIPVILAITLHETAHGYAALALGDDTAKLAGRLSLNPLRHIDRVGTILLPGLLLLSQLLTLVEERVYDVPNVARAADLLRALGLGLMVGHRL